MISKKTKYGIKALQKLALAPVQEPMLISQLAESERIPRKFLEQILLELRNQGILQSRKGRKGGYFLARPASEITLGQVLRILEGPLAPVPCASQTAYARCEECLDEKFCSIRMVMKDVRDAMAGILDQTTLADMAERAANARALETRNVMFHI